MGYYIRILGKADPDIHLDELIIMLEKENLTANFLLDENENPSKWTIINVANSKGEELMQIERNPVLDGEIGKEELEEFRDEIKHCKPKSAVKWLDKFFDKVKVIYTFQLLDRAFDDENFNIVGTIKLAIWNKTGGIFQADYEGFSNESGYHILWQFSDSVTGKWNMAVINIFGTWTNFTMDLSNQKQREEFWKGKVPKDATKILKQ